jgi:hypothetical protein
MLFEFPGEIGWGGNGGFHAINLAIQWGAKRVVLLGIDCSLEGGVHWHGRHGYGLNNPKVASVEKWRTRLDAQAPVLRRMGIEVVIGSPGSALTAYPKVDLWEALHGHSADIVSRGPERIPALA